MDDVNLQLFEGLFPKEYLENVVLTETNQHLNDRLSYGELLRWIGLWVLMSTVDGSDRQSFWSTKAINMNEGAPFRLQQYMSRTRFEAILSATKYTKENPPAFVDRFWEVCELIDAWNESMSKISRQVGSTQLMNQFPNGSMNSPALDSCMCHANHGHLAMNTMMLVVQIQTSSGRWI